MLRIRDDCPMFLTAVPPPTDRGSVKIVFVLLKDHNFKKKEKIPVTSAENYECCDLFRGGLAKIFDYLRKRFRLLAYVCSF